MTRFLILALFLAGCSMGEPVPQGQQFLLRAEVAPPSASARQTDALVVTAANVVAPYAQRTFVYRHAGESFESDPYNGFLAAPSPMITDATIQYLRGRGPFTNVVGEGIVFDARYRLQQVVEGLYAEFLPGTTRAVVQIHYVLTDERAEPPTVLLDQTFTGTAPLADGKPATIAAGLNAALAAVLKNATADMTAAVNRGSGG